MLERKAFSEGESMDTDRIRLAGYVVSEMVSSEHERISVREFGRGVIDGTTSAFLERAGNLGSASLSAQRSENEISLDPISDLTMSEMESNRAA
jgi:hypothetical protein